MFNIEMSVKRNEELVLRIGNKEFVFKKIY